ncbi:MAG TPA: cryptochrome/photolyase family protein [Bryobacteraceae bacterium]|nr:cryptochrome/photolyase family protein [Bryobacteraceae bacterium]
MPRVRQLVLILGDQLSLKSAAFDDFDPTQDSVWMAEVPAESTHVLSHKVRITYFLTAMRHFAQDVRRRRYLLQYRALDDKQNRGTLDAELTHTIDKLKPERLIVLEPGEFRVEEMLKSVAKRSGVELEIRPNRHFYCSRAEFRAWVEKHPHPRMEFFYREMRKRSGVLMERGKPTGGRWNYDPENRKSFGKSGPGFLLPKPKAFPPDRITAEVMQLVNKYFPKHPGTLNRFDLPVTSKDAQAALHDFVKHRLPDFGSYQDAMWTDEPFLFHSRISAPMNLNLLDPHEVVMAVEDAYHRGNTPLAAAEGYIRQIIGWREYVRGIYWSFMPEYLERNALGAKERLPDLYWDGNTDMNCLHQAVGQTLEHGYAHHIQRLMVTGLFALLFGVDPVEVHKWYLAIYWDAVEWVEMPNTTGMSQFADGGLMGSKPYAASGKYINRMSNYCEGCRYRPDESVGENACPLTTLYWDFLLRHENLLRGNGRMLMQVRNLARLDAEKKHAIRQRADQIRKNLPKGSYLE